MTSKTKPKCENCKHVHTVKVDGFVVELFCRRFPPAILLEGRSSAFPIVLEDDLCGEYATTEVL